MMGEKGVRAMLFYIVRHGAPDYKTDTLLPEGERQAELTAGRLAGAGITRIYSSPMGRARQTAAPLAARLGLEVRVEPWAWELGDESKTDWPDGERKILYKVPAACFRRPEYAGLGEEEAFGTVEAFRRSGVRARFHTISDGVDGLLARNGYARNADGLYVPTAPWEGRIALFCHAGMTRVMLSHLLGVPYRLLVSNLASSFTAVARVWFPPDASEPFVPQLVTFGDAAHLEGAAGTREPMESYP